MVPLPAKRTNERIFIKDLCRYLHHDAHAVRKFAREENLVRKVALGTCSTPAEYVSAHGAMRIIAYIRAIQGEYYLRGKQFHEFNESEMLRKRAATHKQLAIAKTLAEAESQGQPAAERPDGACPRL